MLGPYYRIGVVPGKEGPWFFPVWLATATAEDLLKTWDWDQVVPLLRENGLTVGIDTNGYAHIRHPDNASRGASQWARRFLRDRMLRGGCELP
ncbi:MAG TPA: hypothetical protein VMI55_05940 [Thermoplasmata archaeon]|nr:hypothetical protein [Thermoplasmata archaeon]